MQCGVSRKGSNTLKIVIRTDKGLIYLKPVHISVEAIHEGIMVHNWLKVFNVVKHFLLEIWSRRHGTRPCYLVDFHL